ncbi:ImmA/IrrE family metallo-endopeptidase [Staphylococcus sp. FSL W8-1268]
MSVNIEVNSEVLKWGIKVSGKNYNQVKEKFKKIDNWMKNESSPTFNQLEQLSSYLNLPFGYLLLDTPPKEDIELLNFRTIDSEEHGEPSRELIDTIYDMETKKEWMREFLIEEGYAKNSIVNSINLEDDFNVSSNKIREILGLPIEWYLEKKAKDSFNYLKDLISYNGILIMQNGIVKNNTRRRLDINEFRAFCLIDDYAPLIFLNNRDSINGKKFSLMHELVHIALGKQNIFNDNNEFRHKYDKIETYCNKVAAELLIPTDKFYDKWKNGLEKILVDKIYSLSKYFQSSNVVVARKALDNDFIDKEIYNKVVKEAKHSYEISLKKRKSGGNYINNTIAKLDNNFTLAISSGVEKGSTLYSDIYKLTGLKRGTFDEVINRLEGKH